MTTAPSIHPPDAPLPPAAAASRDAGNACMAAGDAKQALACYDQALDAIANAAQGGAEAGDAAATAAAQRSLLLCNRAAALMTLARWTEAATAAAAATDLTPAWPRPWVRLVRALDRAGDAKAAASAGRRGAAATRATPTARAALRDAVDAAVAAAAARGDFKGFDGDVLTVRPAAAGEEWLGKAAPREEGDDDDDDEGDGRLAALPCWDAVAASEKALMVARAPRRLSFRSIHAALAACRDGDVIVLLPGTHNGLGASARVTKRVAIVGGDVSALSSPPAHPSATLDFRGNAPALRFERVAAVVGVAIDATGWREAVCVDGPAAVAVAIAACTVASSGDDGVLVAGRAAATITGCALKAGRHGVVVAQRGRACVTATKIADCGGSGCVVTNDGALTLSGGAVVTRCGADGIRVSGSATATLTRTRVDACAGPALDVSGCGRAAVGAGTVLTQCAGGGWAWDTGRLAIGGGTRIDGGATYALLTHGDSDMTVDPDAMLQGAVSGAVAAAAAKQCGGWVRPTEHVGPPPEAGPFRWDGEDCVAAAD